MTKQGNRFTTHIADTDKELIALIHKELLKVEKKRPTT